MIEGNHKEYGFKVIRQNMEEITLQGWNGEGDQRTVNSYPSKVKIASVCGYCECLACFACDAQSASSALMHTEFNSRHGSFIEPFLQCSKLRLY